MSRAKRQQTSAEIEAAIRRLEEERREAVATEDQRRGELLRGYLGGENGDAIRTALGRVVAPRDAFLFGIEAAPAGAAQRPAAAGGRRGGSHRGAVAESAAD